jgi:ABC-type polysaccharide/polyol phosphate transport system ATPase subunit
MSAEPIVDAVPTPAVEIEALSVRYRVPFEVIVSLKEYAIRKVQRRIQENELLALDDVNLTVQRGERIGVIGPNGAGKSTLFKVIARVRRPSSGRVVVRGKVAPLLELGFGFHGELSGRENIILLGTLMGFSRREMLARTPGIAEFSELGPFLDSAIRTYSTGMSARLAFSVATDVDPDILLVDETLSVGDERFAAKCKLRMANFRERGKTILLVSHSLSDIRESCQRALWVSDGRLVKDGPAGEVCDAYHEWSARGGEAGV